MRHRYLIALGSNKWHQRHGAPERVLAAALRDFEQRFLGREIHVEARSHIVRSLPIGPSLRRYANGAAIIRCDLEPDDLLLHLKALERFYGRNRGAQRWASRVLDLDIILWDKGTWKAPALTIPHAAFRERDFVLAPAVELAPLWRDPVSFYSLRQLRARLKKHSTFRPLPDA